ESTSRASLRRFLIRRRRGRIRRMLRLSGRVIWICPTRLLSGLRTLWLLARTWFRSVIVRLVSWLWLVRVRIVRWGAVCDWLCRCSWRVGRVAVSGWSVYFDGPPRVVHAHDGW